MRTIPVVLLAVLLLAGANFAAYWMVNGSLAGGTSCYGSVTMTGNDTSIQEAIDRAAVGDTIILCLNGTSQYVERIIVNKTVNIFGNESINRILINMSGSVTLINITSNNVNITNLSFANAVTGFSPPTAIPAAIYTNGSNLQIYNVSSLNVPYGFYFRNSSNNNITNNTIHGLGDASTLYFRDNSSNNIIANNIIIASGLLGGIMIINGSNNTIVNNNVTGSILYNFYFNDSSSNNTIANNTAADSLYGFYFDSSMDNNLSLNNASNNNLSQYHFAGGSTAIFTGNNFAYNVPSGAIVFNLSGGSRVTTINSANITTNQLSLTFTNLENLSMSTSFISGTGVQEAQCGSSSYLICQLVSELVNFSQLGTGRVESVTIYYNQSKVSGAIGENEIYLGQWGDAGWSQLGRTALDTTANSVTYGPLTAFSYFGAVGFLIAPTSSGSTPPPASSEEPEEPVIIEIIPEEPIPPPEEPPPVEAPPPPPPPEPSPAPEPSTTIIGTPQGAIPPPPQVRAPEIENISEITTTPEGGGSMEEERKILGIVSIEDAAKGILLLILIVLVILGVLFYIRKRHGEEEKGYKFK